MITVINIEDRLISVMDFMVKILYKILTKNCIEYEDMLLAEKYHDSFDCDFIDIVCGVDFCNPEKTIALIKNYDVNLLFHIEEK